MNLKLIDGTFVENCRKVINKTDFDINKRCFYELHEGTYPKPRKLGVFKEIKDVLDFITKDERLNDVEYINYHNFYIQE